MMLKTSLARVPLFALLCGWILIVGLIALNRGVDLLWGVFVVLLVAIAVAASLPKWQLRGIAIDRSVTPSEGVVGQAVELGYACRVNGPLARHGIEIYDALSGDGVPQLVTVASVKGQQEIRLRWIPSTRGAWHFGGLLLESRFPLALTRARRSVDLPLREVVIYPDYVALRSLPLEAEATPDYEQTLSRRRDGRDELYGLRDYRPGDDVRAMHWRAIARRNELVVKEYEHQQDRRVWILLDLSAVSHVGRGAEHTLEYMVRIAHSVAVKASNESIAVGMCYMQGGALYRIDAGAGRDTYIKLREALARVKAEHQPSLRTWIGQHQSALPAGGTWIVFNLWQAQERSTLLAVAAQRQARILVVEFDKESFVHKSEAGGIAMQKVAQGAVYRIARGADLRELFIGV